MPPGAGYDYRGIGSYGASRRGRVRIKRADPAPRAAPAATRHAPGDGRPSFEWTARGDRDITD